MPTQQVHPSPSPTAVSGTEPQPSPGFFHGAVLRGWSPQHAPHFFPFHENTCFILFPRLCLLRQKEVTCDLKQA